MLHWGDQEAAESGVIYKDPLLLLGVQLEIVELIRHALFNGPTYEQVEGGFPQFAYRSCLKNRPLTDK